MLTLDGIKGVGSATIKKLNELDITSVFELFSFLPSKYIDLKSPVSVADAEAGQLSLFEGEVERVSAVRSGRKRDFYVMFGDLASGGRIHLRATFYNMPFLHDGFEVGQRYRMLARLQKNLGTFEVVNPQLEKLEKISKLDGVFTLYPLRGAMGQNAFKNILYSALDEVKGASYSGALGAVNADILDCFEHIHRPLSVDDAYEAVYRLSSIDLGVTFALYKKVAENVENQRKVFYKTSQFGIVDFKNVMPFEPTPSQTAAFERLDELFSSPNYISAIINGDVGSGKTVVAFYAMLKAAFGGRQSALMAPTEILAEQHAAAFKKIADKLCVSFCLMTSSMSAPERRRCEEGLANGDIMCAIGTQALIADSVKYKNLTCAIIDEQHKFGVGERGELERKGARDVISMTATPIPRSMALTFYEDIEILRIEKRADARTNILTTVVNDIDSAVEYVCAAAKAGRQAFIVCPAIRDAEGYDIFSIESFMRDFARRFDGISIAALHGKLSSEQKAEQMRAFAEGKTQVLVATSVVEVGIDTLASDILILNADRFGLASLHQLRGRVGRDGKEAHCYLHTGSQSERALDRLDAMCRISDGIELAELDFGMRGAGDVLGLKQSGASYTPIFGLKLTSQALLDGKKYAAGRLGALSLNELISLTRRSEKRVRAFIEDLREVTLNS